MIASGEWLTLSLFYLPLYLDDLFTNVVLLTSPLSLVVSTWYEKTISRMITQTRHSKVQVYAGQHRRLPAPEACTSCIIYTAHKTYISRECFRRRS